MGPLGEFKSSKFLEQTFFVAQQKLAVYHNPSFIEFQLEKAWIYFAIYFDASELRGSTNHYTQPFSLYFEEKGFPEFQRHLPFLVFAYSWGV